MLFKKDSPYFQRHKQIESERIKKIVYANSNQKRAEVGILILNKVDFK